jgi:hypothetical protein
MDASVSEYRLALDRLHRASRALADYMEESERSDTNTNVYLNGGLDQIWAMYERTLAECRQAFGQVPAQLRSTVPPPPRV